MDDDDVAGDEVEEDVEDDDAAPQDRDTSFVRACAVEMRIDMSQKPFHSECYRKKRAPGPRRKLAARFVRACAVEMQMDMSQEQV